MFKENEPQIHIDAQQMHKRAEMLVIARMVDAKNHVRILDYWLKVAYLSSIILTMIAIGVMVVVMAADGPIVFTAIGAIAVVGMSWLKYAAFLYHYYYHNNELHRAQHALESIIEHQEEDDRKRNAA